MKLRRSLWGLSMHVKSSIADAGKEFSQHAAGHE
jgi:hypothetical protein